MRPVFLLFTIAAVLCAQPDPDAAEQKKIFADISANALEFIKHLPNFVCTESTRRNVDPTGTSQHWKLVDTIVEQLSYVDHKEEYKAITVNSKSVSNRPGGLWSPTDFANVLNWVFDPKAETEFGWQSFDSLRGARVHLISYKVKPEHSQFTVGNGKTKINAGIVGLISADKDTSTVLRIGLIASDIPPKFPVQAVNMEVLFDFVKIGDQMYLVPVKADLHSKEGKSLIWNEVELRDFRTK